MSRNTMYKNLAAMGRRARLAASFSTALLGLGLGLGPQALHAAPATLPVKAAFVYVAPITEAGWVRQHDQGRLAVEAALGDRVKTTYVQDVPEGADAERVIRDLAQQGHQIIFTPSFGYMEPTLKVAREFPQVKFESITGYKTAANVAVANARYYEGRYLAGIAAGRMSKSHVAGYVAGFPSPEVLAFHTGSSAVMAAAQERGRLAVAYHSDMRKVAPQAQILAVTHEWGAYYTARVKAVAEGSWKPTALWGGVREGMIRVGDFGPQVPVAVQNEVLARQKDMAAGRLQPFKAGAQPVRDNQGHTVIEPGQALSDEQILNLNWLVEGVQGSLR